MPTVPLSAKKREHVIRLLGDETLSNRQIAQRAGVSNGIVSRIALEIGRNTEKKKERANAQAKMIEMIRDGMTVMQVAIELGVSKTTVLEAAKKAKHIPKPHFSDFPAAHKTGYKPFVISDPGSWLILCDVHVPCHDEATIRAAVADAKKSKAVGVIINGDFLDCHELSDHEKDPSAPRYVHEVEAGIQLLAWLRSELPGARIIYKLGNHEERLQRYVMARAAAFIDLEAVTIAGMLRFKDFDIEEVRDKRVINLGKLHVVHGHEYRGGGGVMPARWLYLRTRSRAMCGHFHRTSDFHARNIGQAHEAAWSVGCACDLHPSYAPLNEWNNGYAMVDLEKDGSFSVRNVRVIEGKVY